MSIIIGMAGECQWITDQNQWTAVRTGGSKSSVFLHLRWSYWNTLVHRGLSCHQLFVLLCHSQQAVPVLPQQLHRLSADVVFQGRNMHAFFIHHHEQARNVCKSFRRYRSSWLKKYMWVSRGIELNQQNGGQAAVVDAWAVHGIWWIGVTHIEMKHPAYCTVAQKSFLNLQDFLYLIIN